MYFLEDSLYGLIFRYWIHRKCQSSVWMLYCQWSYYGVTLNRSPRNLLKSLLDKACFVINALSNSSSCSSHVIWSRGVVNVVHISSGWDSSALQFVHIHESMLTQISTDIESSRRKKRHQVGIIQVTCITTDIESSRRKKRHQLDIIQVIRDLFCH